MNWYLEVLKKYAVFQGRARRTEYWMFILVNFLIAIGLGVIDSVLSLGFLSGLYSLAMLIPSIAVGVRRFHDIGKSGWWILLGLIPLLGLIALIIFFVQDSQPGDNAYGPNPKGA